MGSISLSNGLKIAASVDGYFIGSGVTLGDGFLFYTAASTMDNKNDDLHLLSVDDGEHDYTLTEFVDFASILPLVNLLYGEYLATGTEGMFRVASFISVAELSSNMQSKPANRLEIRNRIQTDFEHGKHHLLMETK